MSIGTPDFDNRGLNYVYNQPKLFTVLNTYNGSGWQTLDLLTIEDSYLYAFSVYMQSWDWDDRTTWQLQMDGETILRWNIRDDFILDEIDGIGPNLRLDHHYPEDGVFIFSCPINLYVYAHLYLRRFTTNVCSSIAQFRLWYRLRNE